MELSHNSKPSTDTTDNASAEPPSPAPTYRSTFHTTKDYAFAPNHTSGANEKSSRMDYAITPNHTSHRKEKFSSKAKDEEDFNPVEEPFDTTHPLYIPPAPAPAAEPTPDLPARRSTRRIPPFRILLPWTLFAIFFLTTLWYTSIAFGIRLFHSLSPSPPQQPINIVINPPAHGTPSVVISTATPTSKPPVPGNGVDPDLGTNTMTSKPSETPKTSEGPKSTLVTVMKRVF
ncbi:hypothetical protein K469DRAFT_392993 [Zopfia rhizophila CBS 207.26]|uniref:Uncharacterized protein n=1 Tax=Zopfia rhizophila CBS 207.26 TaxID=1314779 RepID=A0A6A6ELN3_9PEZI|nr:hypothetical protein K469DRAFT_392993 [Zopfia rhizophila CBS 207.26]